MRNYCADAGGGCSAAVSTTSVVIDASSDWIVAGQKRKKKKLFFSYFSFVFPALITHTDGDTLGFILIHTNELFCISTHTPTTQMHLLRRASSLSSDNNFINPKLQKLSNIWAFGGILYIRSPRDGGGAPLDLACIIA